MTPAQFCTSYLELVSSQISWLFVFSIIFLSAALLAVLVAVVISLIAALRTPAAPAPAGMAAATPTILEALRNLVDTLAKAPIWLALVVSAIGLSWLASTLPPETKDAAPNSCRLVTARPSTGTNGPPSGKAGTGSADNGGNKAGASGK